VLDALHLHSPGGDRSAGEETPGYPLAWLSRELDPWAPPPTAPREAPHPPREPCGQHLPELPRPLRLADPTFATALAYGSLQAEWPLCHWASSRSLPHPGAMQITRGHTHSPQDLRRRHFGPPRGHPGGHHCPAATRPVPPKVKGQQGRPQL
jgi:hypothetical protein